MNPYTDRPVKKTPDTSAGRLRRGQPNALRHAQVLPPHSVDLTLPPSAHEDVHVPAHVSGNDLSREGPADGGGAKKRG